MADFEVTVMKVLSPESRRKIRSRHSVVNSTEEAKRFCSKSASWRTDFNARVFPFDYLQEVTRAGTLLGSMRNWYSSDANVAVPTGRPGSIIMAVFAREVPSHVPDDGYSGQHTRFFPRWQVGRGWQRCRNTFAV